MIGKILCAGVLAAALMLLPNPNSGGHIKKSEQAAASNVGQMRQQRAETTSDARNNSDIAARNLLTTEASSQVQQSKRKVPENAPTKPIAAVETEAPNSEPESTARQEKPAVPSNKQGCEQYRHLFEQYNWPVNTALAICQAESSGNIQATNWGDNHGKCKGSFSLMQVGCFWYTHYGYTTADRYNPEVNVKIAYQIYERQKSFGAWTTYTGGRYLKFL